MLFLSCLYGSAPRNARLSMLLIFLSCLYGSARFRNSVLTCMTFSKLPVRQCTTYDPGITPNEFF